MKFCCLWVPSYYEPLTPVHNATNELGGSKTGKSLYRNKAMPSPARLKTQYLECVRHPDRICCGISLLSAGPVHLQTLEESGLGSGCGCVKGSRFLITGARSQHPGNLAARLTYTAWVLAPPAQGFARYTETEPGG